MVVYLSNACVVCRSTNFCSTVEMQGATRVIAPPVAIIQTKDLWVLCRSGFSIEYYWFQSNVYFGKKKQFDANCVSFKTLHHTEPLPK